ncbi:MAG: T9SS type A sorting domain-containing protein [Bacteroidia bacterium]
MKFKKPLLFLCLLAFNSLLYAENNVDHSYDPLLKTFITNIKRLPDAAYQQQLNNQGYWKNFVSKNGQWMVSFNEENQKPHYAVGTPVLMNVNATPFSVANEFIANQLSEFRIPVKDLVYRNTATNQKYHYVHFNQQYNGLEVLWASALIKMTLDNRVMQFGLDVYDDINISTTPALNSIAASNAASNGVAGITKVSTPVLKVLPVPSFHKNIYHLVYEIVVSNKNNENVPAEYYTLVDANTGDILYRQNNVNHIAVNVTGTVYPTQPYNPTAAEPFRNLKVLCSGSNYYTDSTGYADLTGALSNAATLYLEGKWAKVQTAGVTPSFSATLAAGTNNMSFDTHANIKEMSAYQSVQEIHDYYKTIGTVLSLNSIMDFALTTNIDVSGSCNAFYNGSSINFFDLGGGCNPSSEVGDVLYHEYGHGINGHVYNHFGGNFGNGALNEGYADTWANGLTEDPVLGIGFYSGDPNGYIRRYDINKKIYPQDLVGEVHADGEIIAGAWWDVGLNFGNFQSREALFFETFAATLTAANGSEGQLYQDVLIEAITNDDNDGNLNNGTPNYCAITSAFALHGITLNAAVLGLNNTTPLFITSASPVTLSATANSLPGGNFIAHYQLNQSTGTWISTPMTNVGGINYEAVLPSVANGNIVLYYFDVIDQCGMPVVAMPPQASNTNPNIPYNILVGYSQYSINDFDANGGTWTTGAPGDNATIGLWEIATPEGTFINPSDPSTVVQPDAQVTPGGSLCAVTNHLAGSAPGNYDVDNGKTTLISPSFDLTGHINPAFSYYRWYTNDQFAAAILDYWRVAISNDNGSTWVPVENTQTADHSWRRNAFRVSDYITPSNQVKVRFVAEDTPPGGWVEALVDDFVLWDEVPSGITENESALSVSVYPNPANDVINIKWNKVKSNDFTIALVDELGREIYMYRENNSNAGLKSRTIDTSTFPSGIYLLRIADDNTTYTQKVNIIK